MPKAARRSTAPIRITIQNIAGRQSRRGPIMSAGNNLI